MLLDMSRQHDSEALNAAQQTTKARAKPAPAPEPDEDLRSSVGNSGMGQILQPGVSDIIEAELGGGKPIETVPGAQEVARGKQDVRIHDDGIAADLSREMGAVAFTYGRDIFLSGHAPDLASSDGQAMLRHELTHVDQQTESGTTRPKRVSSPESPAEQQATRAQHGGTDAAGTASASAVHRQEEQEEELMMMRAETVHRQEEEEELMMMPADTVHRQEEQEEELIGEQDADHAPASAPDTATQEPTGAPAAANPALAALFETTVIDKFDAAAAALAEEPADTEVALNALNDAWNGCASLMPVYEESDPGLHSELGRIGNGLAMFFETVEPHVHGIRDTADIQAAMDGSNFRALAEAARDRLH